MGLPVIAVEKFRRLEQSVIVTGSRRTGNIATLTCYHVERSLGAWGKVAPADLAPKEVTRYHVESAVLRVYRARCGMLRRLWHRWVGPRSFEAYARWFLAREGWKIDLQDCLATKSAAHFADRAAACVKAGIRPSRYYLALTKGDKTFTYNCDEDVETLHMIACFDLFRDRLYR